MKLEGHMHNTKSSSFLLSITITITNSSPNLHVRLNVSMLAIMLCKRLWVYVCIKMDGYIHFPKTNRLTGVPNSFHDFQIELLEGNLYINYFLTSDLLFICFYTIYTDIIILIDATTTYNRLYKIRTKENEISLRIFSS